MAENKAKTRLIIFAFIVLVATSILVRAATFDRFLPVIDQYDESLRFLHAYSIRSDAPLGRSWGQVRWEAGFPPFQPWFTGWIQRVVEARMAWPMPSDYIYAMRIVSLVLGVLTTVIIAGIGWMLGRPFGVAGQALMGWLTALIWAISPIIVETGSFALLDPLLYPMIAAAMWCAVYAIQNDSPPAIVGSLALVILGIYTKYVVIYALWLPGCAVLVLLWRRGWRRTLPWLVGMGVFSALSAGYLIFVYGAFNLSNRESRIFGSTGFQFMFSPFRNFDNLRFTIDKTMGLALFVVVLVGGTLAYLYSQQHGEPVANARWLWMLIPFVLGCTLLTSSVDLLSQTDPKWFRIRYMLPIVPALGLIWAAALLQIVWALGSLGRRMWAALLVSAVVTIFAVPALARDVSEARRFAQTHGKQIIWTWSDAILPPEGKIMTSSSSDVRDLWNRPWSGYNKPSAFEWVYDDAPQHASPQTFVDEGVLYVVATSNDLNGVYGTTGAQAFLDQLLLLKVVPPGPEVDYSTYFYRMIPPQNQAEAPFGGQIMLIGYDLSSTTVHPGESLMLRPYWQARRTPDGNYSMFIHLLANESPQPLAQYDGSPVSIRRLPLTWTDPDEKLIGVQATLMVPTDLPPGNYRLVLGLYDFKTGVRLSLPDGRDAFQAATIIVQAPNTN
jgi:4-amino-4-deoxy-L-arabinose transferase-like glycosyltransferase